MTKQELNSVIVTETGLSKTDVSIVVESFIKNIKQANKFGEGIYLRGFGSFVPKLRAEKIARNISKGTALLLPARKVAHFKPSPDFQINQ